MDSMNATGRMLLDRRLTPLRKRRAWMVVPVGGWLRAIRTALGMTLDDVARRAGITRSSVLHLERSEVKASIQIDSLRRMATALDCELVYALVPRQSLRQMVEQQKDRRADELNAKMRTHMRLEDQEERDPALDKWRKQHATALVGRTRLWNRRG